MSNENHATRTRSPARTRRERREAAALILALLSEAGLDGGALDRMRRLDADDADFAPDFIAALRDALASPRRRGRRRTARTEREL